MKGKTKRTKKIIGGIQIRWKCKKIIKTKLEVETNKLKYRQIK